MKGIPSETKQWPPETLDDPLCFSPTIDGVLTRTEWKKYNFAVDEEEDVLGVIPDLVVDRPDPIIETP
jgi:hypothetical protein